MTLSYAAAESIKQRIAPDLWKIPKTFTPIIEIYRKFEFIAAITRMKYHALSSN